MNLNDLTLEEITAFADSPAIFKKGQKCYDNRAVDQFFMSGKGIKAKVEGNPGPYSVEIRTGRGNNLTKDCTCAYSGEVCEHIVAVLLYAMLGDPEEEDEYEYEEAMVPGHGIPLSEEQFNQLLTGQFPMDELLGLLTQFKHKFAGMTPEEMFGPGTNVIPFPNSKKMTMGELKQQIQACFEAAQVEDEEGLQGSDYGFFSKYEEPESSRLIPVFQQLENLSLTEQIEVLWYVVTSANLIFSKTGQVFAEVDIAEAVELFADRVMALDLEMPQKEVYLNSLIAAFDWPMFLNEELDLALKDALDTLCSTEEELRYAIATLEQCGLEKNSREWVMNGYRLLGDNDNFIRLYEQNLERVDQYLMLASYFKEAQGDIPKYIAILERWITEQTPKADDENLEDWADLYAEDCPYTNQLLTDLTQYYYEQGDRQNLYRIFLLWLRIDGLCLELYEKIKPLATELNCWEDCQRQMHLFARDDAEVLAKIYLNQQNWEAAISLAQARGCSVAVKQAIAQEVSESHPEEAIALYNQLVHHHIQQKNRANYQTAAKYASLIRDIYLSVLNNPFQGQEYIDALQQQYLSYRALQDELRKIGKR